MKTLKLFLVLVLALVCCSCSNNTEEIQQRIIPAPEATIFGVWEFGEVITECDDKNSIEFTPNYVFAENHFGFECRIQRDETPFTLVNDGTSTDPCYHITYYGTTKTVTELTTTRMVLAFPNGMSEVFTRKQ